eukprot:1322177-Lingulodinium_polyedra.AAC.1
MVMVVHHPADERVSRWQRSVRFYPRPSSRRSAEIIAKLCSNVGVRCGRRFVGLLQAFLFRWRILMRRKR